MRVKRSQGYAQMSSEPIARNTVSIHEVSGRRRAKVTVPGGPQAVNAPDKPPGFLTIRDQVLDKSHPLAYNAY
jgi:hypothetical protein